MRLRDSPRLRRAAGGLAAAWIRLAARTVRWRDEGGATRAAVAEGGPWIVLVWHGRLAMLPAEPTGGREIRAMISANRDGDVIAEAAARFGAAALRGSAADPRKPDKDKRGGAAARAALRALAQGAVVCITPDGPRGPAERLQPGVAWLAAASGARVAPFAFAARPCLRLRSWDGFVVPLPFGRGARVWGEAVAPPADRSAEGLAAHAAVLEAALAAATARAEALAGGAA